MVGCCYDGDEDHCWINDSYPHVEKFPSPSRSCSRVLQRAAYYTSVIDHRAADDEPIAEVHRGHGSKGVDVIAGHEDGVCIVMANSIEEAVLRRKQARRHARVEGEGQEGEEVS